MIMAAYQRDALAEMGGEEADGITSFPESITLGNLRMSSIAGKTK